MGPLAPLVETFGPFLIPVAVFTVGAVGYLALLALNRALGTDEASKWRAADEREEPGETGETGEPGEPGGAGEPEEGPGGTAREDRSV